MTSALDGVSGQRCLTPAAIFPRGKDPGTHWTGGWAGPRAILDTEVREKNLSLPEIKPPLPGCPICRQTLC
jgi:hypothetical protein